MVGIISFSGCLKQFGLYYYLSCITFYFFISYIFNSRIFKIFQKLQNKKKFKKECIILQLRFLFHTKINPYKKCCFNADQQSFYAFKIHIAMVLSYTKFIHFNLNLKNNPPPTTDHKSLFKMYIEL